MIASISALVNFQNDQQLKIITHIVDLGHFPQCFLCMKGFFLILFCIYQSGVTLRFKHVEQLLTLTAKVILSLQLEVAVPARAAGAPTHVRLAVALPTFLDKTHETTIVSGESEFATRITNVEGGA